MIKKYAIILLLCYVVLYHSFDNGYWIFGWAIPGVTSIAIDSDGRCIKYEGEVRQCTIHDLSLIMTLYGEN